MPDRLSRWLAVLLVLLAVGWRLVHVTSWPLPFHPTVQYDSANAARTIWLWLRGEPLAPKEKAWLAARPGRFVKLPILQTLTALMYLPDSTERPWVSGLFASLFWLGGGWCLFAFVRRLGTGMAGALVSLAYYLLAPFGIVVSRSFQPEAVLVFAFLASLWALPRFDRESRWRATTRAGITAGLAMLVKPGIVLLPLLGAYVACAVRSLGLRGTLRSRQTYAFGLLTVLPSAVYTLAFLSHHVGAKIIPQLWADPNFYAGWGANIQTVVGWVPLAAAVIGAWLFRRTRVPLLSLGLGLGYIASAFVFTWHTMTHDYYQVPLLVLTAICIGPLGDYTRVQASRLHAYLLAGVRPAPRAQDLPAWCTVAAVVVFLAVGVLLPLPTAGILRGKYADTMQIQLYEGIGRHVGRGNYVLCLSKDYGLPLMYHGWIVTHYWPASWDKDHERVQTGAVVGDAQRLEEMLQHSTLAFFVVTDLDELARQPALAALLTHRYPVSRSIPDVLIYDLQASR